VKLVALTPPKVTAVAPVKLLPLIVTTVPTGPLAGEKLEITGVTRKATLLESVWPDTVTWTFPVVAPLRPGSGDLGARDDLEGSRGTVKADAGRAR